MNTFDGRPIAANTGRRYDAKPVATDGGPRVRMPVTSPHGSPLPSIGDGFTVDAAEALGARLIAAAAVARHLHAQLTEARA